MSGWDQTHKALWCLPSDGGIHASAPRAGVSVGGGRRSLHPMGCPLTGPQKRQPHVQPRYSGRGCPSALTVPPEVWSPGCPQHSTGSPGSGSQPHGPLPWGCNDQPPHPLVETLARLNMSTNQLCQSLAPACCSPLPRVPPRCSHRDLCPADQNQLTFSLYLPLTRELCVSKLISGKHCGTVRLHGIFKPQ